MTNYLTRTFKRFKKDEKGVTLVEYGIALTMAVALGTLALTSLSGAVSGEMGQATTVMTAND